MRRPIRWPLVVAILAALAVVAGLVALASIPSWELRLVADDRGVDTYRPVAWSPDGTAVLASGSFPFFEVVRPDDDWRLWRDGRGYSPVWIDDRTLMVLDEIEFRTSVLRRIDLVSGERRIVGDPLASGRLVADGRGHVAWRNVIGDPETLVLDSADGHVVARIPDVRAVTWANDGTLVLKETAHGFTTDYPDAGYLSAWNVDGGSRPIGAGLVMLRDAMLPSPASDAIACLCASADAPADGLVPGIYRVPLDGSPATLLMRLDRAPFADPAMTWLDDTSLAIVDGSGLSRVSLDGDRQAIPGAASDALRLVHGVGRPWRLRDAIAVTIGESRSPADPQEEKGRLIVIDESGGVLVDSSFGSWNDPYMVPNRTNDRAILVSDPNGRGPSLSLVEYR